MEKDKIERFLPLGTVVMLKGGQLPVMIIGYSIDTKDGSGRIFDYNATFYPMGTIDTNIVTPFNHDQIEEVIFKGYENEDSITYRESIKQVDAYLRLTKLVNPEFKEEK